MGLYGNILVSPPDPEYWPSVHRELALTLDDILIEEGKVAAFSPDETTYVAMGRFGNVMLISGEDALEIEARRGESSASTSRTLRTRGSSTSPSPASE